MTAMHLLLHALLLCLCAIIGGDASRWSFNRAKLFRAVRTQLIKVDTDRFKVYMTSTGVSGIHAVLTPYKTIILLDRTDVANSFSPPNRPMLPGCVAGTGKDCVAYAVEIDIKTSPPRLRGVNTLSNVFCSAGVTATDGTVYSIGGNLSPDSGSNLQFQGVNHIRILTTSNSFSGDFTLDPVGLTTGRWYPGTILLGDGRTLIVGGANCLGAIAQNTPSKNSPSYEYYPRASTDGSFNLDLLSTTIIFNLYPHLHLLPNGLVFVYAGGYVSLLNTTSNTATTPLAVNELEIRNYPFAGSSVLLPLGTATSISTPEVLICGGSSLDPTTDGGLKYLTSWQTVPAATTCIRFNAYKPSSFVRESMTAYTGATAQPRVMPDLVITPDGSVEIVNGADGGYGSLKSTTMLNPVYFPLTYVPTGAAGKRIALRAFNQKLKALTNIARGYHSTALLLPDATIFIAGSNPNAKFQLVAVASDPFLITQMKAEKYYPNYFTSTIDQPTIDDAFLTTPLTLYYGQTFTLTGTSTEDLTDTSNFRVALIHPGFSTHSSRYSQRMVELTVSSVTVRQIRPQFLLPVPWNQ
eukprot:TRINITY_DN7060_c0_g1_i1.p1 TRINITY_DN7060_c0_g1~~TRINITY_DN7060_c0_g1_i1.p1  ORF type:complete len:579 (+),score=108.92 TRINITY_DN7060_c0_g1_i1:674-2410(+)